MKKNYKKVQHFTAGGLVNRATKGAFDHMRESEEPSRARGLLQQQKQREFNYHAKGQDPAERRRLRAQEDYPGGNAALRKEQDL